MRARAAGLAGLAALLLGGCMVGPDYTKPSVPMTSIYKEADGWKVAQPGDHLPRGQWWVILGDPELHALEEQVAAANQNLKIAEARLREARALVRFNRAALFPTISAGFGISSIRDSANRPFLTPNVNTGSSGDLLFSLDMSYEIDLWGRVRRTVAAARNEAQATAADLETARLSLQAELAMDYFELRAADAQKQLLDATVTVAEANEQIGIAKAAYYPTLMLNASVGFEGSSFGNVLNASSLLWAVGASITQTIFDGGRRRATSDAARAAYDATVAGYRQTTLTAFQQVEDNLAALRILEQEAQQQRRAVESAQLSLQLFTNRYRGGVDNYLQVITAQTVTLTNQRVEIDILRRRMDASVLLVKAVGGGWDASALSKAAK